MLVGQWTLAYPHALRHEKHEVDNDKRDLNCVLEMQLLSELWSYNQLSICAM